MERLYTIFILPLSPFIAFLLDILIRTNLSQKIVAILGATCILIAAPLLFTDYEYGDFYSYWIVIAIISTILLFIGMKYFRFPLFIKIMIVLVFTFIYAVPTGLTFFGRGFVGDDTTFDTQSRKGYKIIYKREADPVLNGASKVELYKTILFGLLQEYRDMKYVISDSCIVTLNDKSNLTIVTYDHCKQMMTIK